MDTIRFIDVFGWRPLTPIEREGMKRECMRVRPRLMKQLLHRALPLLGEAREPDGNSEHT